MLLSEINFEQQFTVYCVRDVLSGRYEILSAIGRSDEVRKISYRIESDIWLCNRFPVRPIYGVG